MPLLSHMKRNSIDAFDIVYHADFNRFFSILETLEYMKPVIDLANEVLWHWKTFPIILPPPIETKIEPAAGKFASYLIITYIFVIYKGIKTTKSNS